MKDVPTMKSKQMRTLTYSRVSTADKQNPEAQVEELRRYCDSRGWTICEEITDRGFSGGTGPEKRPGLVRLMALARARKIDVICVSRLDRLFRSLKHLVTVLDELQSLGVMFVSIGDQIDMTTASGRLMLQIVGAFSEFERGLIRERTVAGLAYVRSRGQRLGRPKTCDDAAILKLRAEGLSYTKIQQRLGVSRPSIRRALIALDAGTKTPKISARKNQANQGGDHE
jgi:DNA invertase Pin-like site-specific DNA recombinase